MGNVKAWVNVWAERDGVIVLETVVTSGEGDTVAEAADAAIAEAQARVAEAVTPKAADQ